MYRSEFRRVSVPVVGTLGVFVLVCALGATAEAFDTPTVKSPAAAQPQEVEQSVEPGVAPVVAPVKILRPAAPTRSAMAGPPANDLCADAIPISDGITAFDTTGADTDGPTHPECDTAGDGGVTVNDIWYHYTATCTGTATIATCNEDGGDAFYDSDLVIYSNTDCGDLQFLGCNDDAETTCTASGTTFASRLIVDVVEDQVYTLRVGGWAGAGDEGPGDLSIGCAFCGNDACEPGENCLNCPEDCADGSCDGGETCGTCPADCGECPCASETPGDCDDAQIGIQNFPLQEFPNFGDCWDLDGNAACDFELGPCDDNSDCPEGSTCSGGTCTGEDIDEDGDCDIADCLWTGLAFPIVVEGTSIDTITFQVNTNLAGGDIYLTGAGAESGCGDCPTDVDGNGETKAFDLAVLLGAWGPIPKDADPAILCLDFNEDGEIRAGDLAVLLGSWGDCPVNLGGDVCQPNIFDMRRMLGCAVSGLEAGVPHDLHFEAIETTPGETIWAIFVSRSGLAELSGLGFYNGAPRPGHQVARSAIIDSQPNNSFGNLVGTGNVGDWTDLHGFDLGTFYCTGLSSSGLPADIFDCVANPDPVGGCCGLPGDTCEMLRGFECGAVGGAYLGDGTTCGDCNPFCTEDAGDCCTANGTPGCEDSNCCHHVCGLDPFCCDPKKGEGWTSPCAQEANDTETGCGQLGEVCEPTECVDATAETIPECIQTGSDDSEEGYLGIVTDEYGAHASVTWSGGNDDCAFGDWFNPDSFGVDEPTFGAALFWYKTDTLQRVVLSDIENHDTTYPVDFSGFAEIPEGGENVASDASGNGVNDTLNSSFAVCGPNDVSLTFTLEQKVERFVPLGGAPIAVWTQVYHITNVSGTAISFVLARQNDQDMFWIGSHLDDVVGTMTNTNDIPGADLSVYQMENGRPSTALTLSSPQASTYWGGKGGFDPDGPGGGPAYGCGTDFQQWDAYGVPQGWANNIAGVVPNNTDGVTPPDFPGGCGGCTCDGSIGITVDVLLEPDETTCVCIQQTFGQRVPWMGGTCPEGCDE